MPRLRNLLLACCFAALWSTPTYVFGYGLEVSSTTPSVTAVSPLGYGAIGDGVHNDTAALNAAGATGRPIDGGGFTYAYSGNWTPTSNVISNITLKQLDPNFDGRRTLLYNGTCGTDNSVHLDNVRVLRNGSPTDAGTENDNFGIDIQCSATGANVYLNNLEVSGGGPGAGIAIFNHANIFYHGLYVHDMRWSQAVNPGVEQLIGVQFGTAARCVGNGVTVVNLDALQGSSNGTTVPSALATSAGTTITISGALAGETWGPQIRVVGAGFPTGTIILSNGTGSGGDGTYVTNNAATIVSPVAITAPVRAYQSDAIDMNAAQHCWADNVYMESTGEGLDVSGSGESDDVHITNSMGVSIDAYAYKMGSATNSSISNATCNDAGLACAVFYTNSTTPQTPTNNLMSNIYAINTGSNGYWSVNQPNAFQFQYSMGGPAGAMVNAQCVNCFAWNDASVPTMPYAFRVDTGITMDVVNPQAYGFTTNFATLAGVSTAGMPYVPTMTSGTFGIPALGGSNNIWSGGNTFGVNAGAGAANSTSVPLVLTAPNATGPSESLYSGASNGTLQFFRADTTLASPSSVALNDNLGVVQFRGYSSTNSAFETGAQIFAKVTAPSGFSTTDWGTSLTLRSTTAGAITTTDSLVLSGTAAAFNSSVQMGTGATRNIIVGTNGVLTQTYNDNAENAVHIFNDGGVTAAGQGFDLAFGFAQSGTPATSSGGRMRWLTSDTYAAAGSSSSKAVFDLEHAGSPSTMMVLDGVDLSVKLPTLANASGNEILCYATSGGAVTYEPSVVGCVPSALRFKTPFDTVSLELASDRLDNLHAAVWTYKDKAMWGDRPYVGLYADDVAKMDPRCVDYDKDGKLANYEDRCVIAYLVATVQLQKQQIAQLQHKAARRRY